MPARRIDLMSSHVWYSNGMESENLRQKIIAHRKAHTEIHSPPDSHPALYVRFIDMWHATGHPA